MSAQTAKDSLEAGTGFMQSPTEALRELALLGYTDNLVPRYDHIEVNSGKTHLNPDEFEVDSVIRFENTSDPDDQSILYAISYRGRKGTFLESYGLYHEDMSAPMIRKMMRRRNVKRDAA